MQLPSVEWTKSKTEPVLIWLFQMNLHSYSDSYFETCDTAWCVVYAQIPLHGLCENTVKS